MVVSKPESAQFGSDSSYLIVGGVGGIGRSISRWMVKQGVKHLILLSKSGLTRQPARDLLDELSDAGCNVAIFSCDITDKGQLQRVVEKCASSMPPIRGVIQAAMALKDCIFEQMPFSSYTEALYPKVHGTWNLHEHFPDQSLDFFVMLSSAAGIGGNPGQANYAAGSTFLDAIARYRASKGMPGVTLDLGVIQDVGYVAENKDLASRLERSGHVAIKEHELLSMIEAAIISPIRDPRSSQIVTGLGGDGQEGTPWMTDLKFSILQQKSSAAALQSASGSKGGLPEELSGAKSLSDAVEIICSAIAGKLSQDFMISPSDINFDESLGVYGVDSLVAVELRNWILRHMKADTSIFDVLQSKTLRVLAEKIATKSEYVKNTTGNE
ncbi:type I polyketide synthase [Phlyctema vagabunda]|uniref:Type I polyketide synthase n=1 Tax=Phlyctema vagabunda TaxID=108571 RepID=A0ABR4PWB3_9HELO